MRKITVILADDEPVARSGILAMISQAVDIDVVGEAQDGYEAQRMVADLLPDVLLLDLKMPGPGPAVLERWVREHCPKTATLVLTGHHRSMYLAEMMEAGAAGYLTKSANADVLLESIRRAARGIVQFTPEQEAEAAQWQKEVGRKWESLSRHEQEILKWLALGGTNRFIAGEFNLSERTVENHIAHILKKLGMNRHQAVAWMHDHFLGQF